MIKKLKEFTALSSIFKKCLHLNNIHISTLQKLFRFFVYKENDLCRLLLRGLASENFVAKRKNIEQNFLETAAMSVNILFCACKT